MCLSLSICVWVPLLHEPITECVHCSCQCDVNLVNFYVTRAYRNGSCIPSQSDENFISASLSRWRRAKTIFNKKTKCNAGNDDRKSCDLLNGLFYFWIMDHRFRLGQKPFDWCMILFNECVYNWPPTCLQNATDCVQSNSFYYCFEWYPISIE